MYEVLIMEGVRESKCFSPEMQWKVKRALSGLSGDICAHPKSPTPYTVADQDETCWGGESVDSNI